MTLHLGGEPESIYWNGPASEVYLGSDLVWSAEQLVVDHVIPPTTLSTTAPPHQVGDILLYEPPGPGSRYRLDANITFNPEAIQFNYRGFIYGNVDGTGESHFVELNYGQTAAEFPLLNDQGCAYTIMNITSTPVTVSGYIRLYRLGDA